MTSKTGEIVIEDFEYDVVDKFVQILHAFELDTDQDPIMMIKIQSLAHKYDVEFIEKVAADIDILSLVTKENFVEVFR